MKVKTKRITAAVVAAVVMFVGGCYDEPQPVEPKQPLIGAIPPGPYVPGQTYFGRNNYIEYVAGNLPLVFSTPHDGGLKPSEITDRTDTRCGTDVSTGRDTNTGPLTREIQAAFFNRTGKYPHFILNHLHRVKLDMNRDFDVATCGDNEAEIAWNEFHDFIQVAKDKVMTDFGKGFYTDIHCHGHSIQRIELGYDLSGSTLRLENSQLDANPDYETASTIKVFSQESPLSFSALLRGPTGLGTLLVNEGYAAVPSQTDESPESGDPYFSGGYNTERHGCKDGGQICGVQIEANFYGLLDSQTKRQAFAENLVDIYIDYLATNFGIIIGDPPPPTGVEIIVDNDDANNDLSEANFSASSNWSTTTDNVEKYLNNFDYAEGDGPTNDGASFLFKITEPGTYNVYSWWPSASNRSTSVSYRVFELDGGTMLADITRNQQINGGQWNLLGTYNFTQVGWAKVLMSRSLSGPGRIAADGLKVTKQ